MSGGINSIALEDWLKYKGLGLARGKHSLSKIKQSRLGAATAEVINISEVESIQLRAVSYSIMKKLDNVTLPPDYIKRQKQADEDERAAKRKRRDIQAKWIAGLTAEKREALKAYNANYQREYRLKNKESMNLYQAKYRRAKKLKSMGKP